MTTAKAGGPYTPASNSATLHPQDNFYVCQIVHWDPLNAKRSRLKKLVWAM